MEDKIKIYISEEINDILLKDMEYFEFFKKDGSLNRNDFINTLVINYFDIYHQKQANDYDLLKAILDESIEDELHSSSLAHDILNLTSTFGSEGERSDIVISLKPTKKSSGIIEYIQSECLEDISMSSYFRNMFSSYCQMPQNKREEIIFKDNFEAINEAIDKHRKLFFSTKRNPDKHIIEPYAIGHSKEELFNYVVSALDNRTVSFRVSRMRNIRVLNQSTSFSEEQVVSFENTLKHGPQFAYDNREEICVKLSNRGIDLFERFYTYRPKPIRIVKNLYYFDCSPMQIIVYFTRFGKDAVILYPKEIRDKMYNFYSKALKEYRNINS